jgi:alpha-1,3-rhamnosyl/mannosyltransferase
MGDRKSILVNDLALYRQRSGIGCYVAELLDAMDGPAAGLTVVPLSRTLMGRPLRTCSSLFDAGRKSAATPASLAGPSVPWRVAAEAAVQFVRRFGHSALNQYMQGFGKLRRWGVYHEPDAVPLAIDAPTVATFHDLSVLRFPHWHPPHRVKKYEDSLKAGLERTSLFLADSESTRQDMVRHLSIDESRIEVIPLAPRRQFRSLDATVVAEARKRLELPAEFLLFLGTIEPRKNIAGLLRAYAALPASLRRRYPLLLVGGWGWRSEAVRAMLDQPPWNTDVRWLGYLSDDDVVATMNAASAVVYPSFYEGFGLPPLEAMACDVPVITTHGGSLEEVVGDAAAIVDPHDDDSMTIGMEKVLANADLADEYRRRGRRRLARYNWADTARRTAQAYRKVA